MSSSAYYEKYIRGIISEFKTTGKLNPTTKNTKLLREAIKLHLSEREGVPTGGDDIVGDMIPSKKPSPDRKPNREVQRAKVKVFFDKLEATGMSKYLQFSNVLDQADAIVKFARIVGVPPNKIADIITNFRNIASKRNADAEEEAIPETEPTPEPTQEPQAAQPERETGMNVGRQPKQEPAPGQRRVAPPARGQRPTSRQRPAPEDEDEEI